MAKSSEGEVEQNVAEEGTTHSKADERTEPPDTSTAPVPPEGASSASNLSDASPKHQEGGKSDDMESTSKEATAAQKVDVKTTEAESPKAIEAAESSKPEPTQKESASSSTLLATPQLPPPPPRPAQEADGSAETLVMPLPPPPPPGTQQRSHGVPQPPRPPGIEAMPWLPMPPTVPGQFPGLFPNALGNGFLSKGLSVAIGGGPEVLEVWKDYFQSYRQYVDKLGAEGDTTSSLFTASALGGVRSEKVCVHHLTGNCRRGFRCIDRHPVDGNFKVHVRDFKRKLCRYADQCRTPKCLYYHPHEGDAWSEIPAETSS
mmetsp:Transcript_68894/g.109300  ORF Transcript_68894/g.109300 Transcript_68894/m.109300 type:complete len:317 (+) Transcript_68894:63-1013(+)